MKLRMKQKKKKLEETIRKSNVKDITILLGDMNAKPGSNNTGVEQVIGKHGLRVTVRTQNSFANHCANSNLVIGGTLFPHKKCHLVTWVSHDRKPENHTDQICISEKYLGKAFKRCW